VIDGFRGDAEMWRRALAFVLDAVMILSLAILGWVALVLILRKNGQTPGKWLVGIAVIDKVSSRPVGTRRLILRELVLKFILAAATLTVSHWAAAVLYFARGEPWWDTALNTRVVKVHYGFN
jgi:uncharacterized RDD family membrane protein YckC